MKQPLFSIVTVTYNAAATLPHTLASVARQTCTDYEHLIIDGLSDDGTVELARERADGRTVISSMKDSGIYDAMNRGISLARGQYLIFMNAGDTFHSDHTLQAYADAIHTAPNPGIAYGQTILVSGADRTVTGPRHLTAPRVLTPGSFSNGMLVCHQSMAVRRDIAPMYDLRYRYSADYDWAIRCIERSDRNVYIDDIVTDYLYEGVTTANHKASLKERYRIMCHHYGTMPTMLRHARFTFRHLWRRLTSDSKQ